jgi:hypothetical protein
VLAFLVMDSVSSSPFLIPSSQLCLESDVADPTYQIIAGGAPLRPWRRFPQETVELLRLFPGGKEPVAPGDNVLAKTLLRLALPESMGAEANVTKGIENSKGDPRESEIDAVE